MGLAESHQSHRRVGKGVQSSFHGGRGDRHEEHWRAEGFDRKKTERRMKRTSSLAAALPVLFCLAFILLWWNRYLAVTNDGWHFLHGLQISNGRIPYRDFFLFIPPLHPLKEAALIALFGNH